ncbi:hypothetical protein [Ruminococcus sp. FC2018]|uniref:hypothetical protein n=1 Tax=Ruminococcus sp. FC2018 TaxID=1410617 RepID=UPI0004910568|nr:hypothetical protein [Ruminococcus sp. FC2018]
MAVNFGFSYVGLVFLIMLFVPNIIWSKNQPEGYEQYADKENKVLLLLERTGEVLVSTLCLIFSDFNIHGFTKHSIFLGAAFALMILYEIYWIRYFRSEKTMADMYSAILGIPVAGATLPVLAFFLLGVYGKNIPMMIATVILGIGHIGIHLQHKNQIK